VNLRPETVACQTGSATPISAEDEQSAVEGLLNWFEHEFRGTLDDGKNLASFEIAGGLGALMEALREAVTGVKS